MPVHLAQVNIAQLSAPLDSAQLSDFVSLLAPVNAAADAAAGFVWRLQTEDGDAIAVRAFEIDQQGHGVIVNMSVWQDLASLHAYVYGDLHCAVLRRRRGWFEHMTGAYTACWWVPAGYRPTVDDAEVRLAHLRQHGPTPTAFTLQQSFPAPHPVAGPSDSQPVSL